MNKLGRLLAVASLSVLGTLAVSTNAHALEESTRGPLYFQSSPLGVGLTAYCAGPFCATNGNFHLDLEAGYHFMGHHDGFVAALRQSFYFSSFSAGTTQARLGWDIAIPIADGKYEVTIAPYATLGIGYYMTSNNPNPAFFALGFGVEGKFFFYEGLYAFFRPFEGGAAIASSSGFLANFAAAGIGYAM